MFGEMPDHIRARHAKDIPSLGSLDDIRLPSAPLDGVVLEPLRAEVKDAVLDNSAKLENITNKALDRLDEFVSEPMYWSDIKRAQLQMEAVKTALTMQLRVDNTRLKRKDNDTLAKLLARMSEEELKLTDA